MKVYKNPWVSRKSYFVKTGKGFSHKNEASKSKGYIVERDTASDKWVVRKGEFYDSDLKEIPLVAENRISIQSVIDNAIIEAVLEATDYGTK